MSWKSIFTVILAAAIAQFSGIAQAQQALSEKDFEDCVVYQSEDVPLNIIDDGSSYTISELTIAESFSIADLNVRVDITHPWVADLTIELESPEGTIIELSAKNGGHAANYTATIFDDQGAEAIQNGTAPFTGCYVPEDLLSTFTSENAQGTWKLRVLDDFGKNGDSNHLLVSK